MDIIKQLHFASRIWIIALPALFMALDICTGLVYAWESGTFKSSKMREGLGKKFGELTYIVIGVAVTVAMSLPEYLIIGIATYILFMEFLSIVENCDKLGAPIPGFIRKALAQANESLQNDDLPTIIEKVEELEKKVDDLDG
ncbi:MAG: phage holin family protein [Fibrobacter sp.]|nr:phage holin family protein [Fibrobacter sp.]